MKNPDEYKLIQEMMSDNAKQESLYTAGNYWKFYEKNILKQIKNNDLKYFRSWPGGSGSGNIQSFGGGEHELSSEYLRNFHPFDHKFEKLDNNIFVKKYNGLINKISKLFPFFSFFSIRSSEGRKYFFRLMKEKQNYLYELISTLDKSLVEISDSEFGNPIGFYKSKKFYTTKFLEELLHIHFIKKNCDIYSMNSITELGPGIGLMASGLLKLNKNLKYLLVDIPPILFFSEYFLKNLGFKVFGYREVKKSKKLDLNVIFKDFQVCVLPPWKLNLLNNFKTDLFINVESFQEMEKEQSQNYLRLFQNSAEYIYLDNAIHGHKKIKKKDSFGVINSTTKADLEKTIFQYFEVVDQKIYNKNVRFKALYKKIISN